MITGARWLNSALREAAGNTVVERLKAEGYALPLCPVVSVFGAYDAGKSTLLKRLLVEAGAAVPPWLTVSARRETFEVNAVEAFGCMLRDTPGIAAGSASHEVQALEAVASSDVIMLVMPPQLLTGDHERTLSILSGKAFRPGGLSLAKSLLVVIAKLDEGTVDPVEDPTAYKDYVSRKCQEWEKLLSANDVPAAEAPVFAVSADPFQRVGNDTSPAREDYDEEYRAWDGIRELINALEDLPDRLPALRRAGRVRRLCWHLWATLDNIQGRLREISSTRFEVGQTKKRFANFVRKHEALLGVARDELDRAVAEELLTFARRGSADAKEVADRLEGCITRWEKTQEAALDKLIAESQAEIETRERARRSIDIVNREDDSPQLRLSFDKMILDGMTTHVKRVFDTYVEFQLHGKTLAKAREDLLIKTNAKMTDIERQEFEAQVATEKEMIGKLVTADLIISCVPHLINLGSILYGEFQKVQEAKEREARRAEARQALQYLGKQISNEAWTHFSTMAKAFSDWVSANVAQVDEMLESLEAEEVRLTSAALGLRTALEGEPMVTV